MSVRCQDEDREKGERHAPPKFRGTGWWCDECWRRIQHSVGTIRLKSSRDDLD